MTILSLKSALSKLICIPLMYCKQKEGLKYVQVTYDVTNFPPNYFLGGKILTGHRYKFGDIAGGAITR